MNKNMFLVFGLAAVILSIVFDNDTESIIAIVCLSTYAILSEIQKLKKDEEHKVSNDNGINEKGQ